MCRMMLAFVVIGAMAISGAVEASEGEAPLPRIAVERMMEDGVDLLLVTVTADGQPREGATVQAYIPRAFGRLVLGEELTFDDGTAFISLPAELPPASSDRLTIITELTAPEALAGTRGSIELAGASIRHADLPHRPHRALWARHAPVMLLMTLAALLGGVWATYGFVVYQVIQLTRKV